MDSRVWQRYVAVACGQAWNLDVHATEELVHCIEALAAVAPEVGCAAVNVFAGSGIGEVAIEGRSDGGRVRIRLKCGSGRDHPDDRPTPSAGVPHVLEQNWPLLSSQHGLSAQR